MNDMRLSRVSRIVLWLVSTIIFIVCVELSRIVTAWAATSIPLPPWVIFSGTLWIMCIGILGVVLWATHPPPADID